MKRIIKNVCIIALLTIIQFGCASNVKKVSLFEENPEHIWLESFVKKAGGQNQDVSQGYDHPAQLTAKQINLILDNVHMKEHSLLKWSGPKKAFIEEDRSKLSPWLSEALGKANSFQWVNFSITSYKKSTLFKKEFLTDGICFIKDGKLNLVTTNINFNLHEEEIDQDNVYKKPEKGDPRDIFYSGVYRFITYPDKGISKPPIIEGDKWLKKEHYNWLVFDLEKLFSSQFEHEKQPQIDIPQKSDIKGRLKKLKELHDQDLISDEEYEQKRKEILNEL